jgi:hypothetical protein
LFNPQLGQIVLSLSIQDFPVFGFPELPHSLEKEFDTLALSLILKLAPHSAFLARAPHRFRSVAAVGTMGSRPGPAAHG